MRKYFGIIFTILLAFILVACGGNKLTIEATFVNVEPALTSVSFDLEIDDPNNELGEMLTIRVFRPDGSLFTEYNHDNLSNLSDFSVGNLLQDTTYTIKVYVISERRLVSIGELEFKTLSSATVEITTPEQFLTMGTNRSGNYVLMNDLDFEGIAFNTPFSSAFSGTFDGQGYTIKNVNFEKITTYTGLFGYISSGTVKNLVLENITIGSEANPLNMTTSSRVGIIAGYVSASVAEIKNIEIKDSSIYYTSSSTVQAYVGGAVGELRAKMTEVSLDNVSVYLKSTSYGRIRVGGAVGFLTEDGIMREVQSHVDVQFEMAGNNIKDRDIQINVGGLIGQHNASTNNRSLENVYAKGDIDVSLDYGTAAGATQKTYSVYVGGIAGIAYSNVLNAFYDGSISVTHEKNANEANILKTYFVGGIFGFYGSNRTINQTMRLGNGNTINILVSDDYRFVRSSQTLGQNVSAAVQHIGIYGTAHLNLNGDDLTTTDQPTVYTNPLEVFTSEWIKTAFSNLD